MRSTTEKLALRAQHTCVLRMESRSCTACNRGVPYPALTMDETMQSMRPSPSYRACVPRLRFMLHYPRTWLIKDRYTVVGLRGR